MKIYWKFFWSQEIINQWNSNHHIDKKWDEYIETLLSQGLLWFTSKEVLNSFISPYDFPKLMKVKILNYMDIPLL